MAKFDSVTDVKTALMGMGVPSQLLNTTGRIHTPTKLNPDLILHGSKKVAIITAVSTARERWQLHDWRAMRVRLASLLNINDPMEREFRLTQGLETSDLKLAFYLIMTEEGTPGVWQIQSKNLSGIGLEAMFHINDYAALVTMIDECGL